MILIHDYIIRELWSTKKGKGSWVDPTETYIMKDINDIVIFANKTNITKKMKSYQLMIMATLLAI